jgi:hypothetical protein
VDCSKKAKKVDIDLGLDQLSSEERRMLTKLERPTRDLSLAVSCRAQTVNLVYHFGNAPELCFPKSLA